MRISDWSSDVCSSDLLKVAAKGDLHIDQHRTTEDTAIAIGEALSKALGDRKGITRYGHAYAPMDETLRRVALDISGRPFTVWKAEFRQKRLGDFDTERSEERRVGKECVSPVRS